MGACLGGGGGLSIVSGSGAWAKGVAEEGGAMAAEGVPCARTRGERTSSGENTICTATKLKQKMRRGPEPANQALEHDVFLQN